MMKRYAVLGIIIALVVSIAAIGCSSKSTTHKPTPTHTVAPTTAVSTPTTEATAEPTETQEANEATTATSLDFTVEYVTEGTGSATYRYRARNIGTSDLDIRIDGNVQGVGEISYILSGSAQNGWIYTEGQWVSYTDSGYTDFNLFWDAWAAGFNGYHQSLVEGWTGLQNWTYAVPGVGSVTYTNIDINPVLPDSVFQPD
jgi:hypothetical protein